MTQKSTKGLLLFSWLLCIHEFIYNEQRMLGLFPVLNPQVKPRKTVYISCEKVCVNLVKIDLFWCK